MQVLSAPSSYSIENSFLEDKTFRNVQVFAVMPSDYAKSSQVCKQTISTAHCSFCGSFDS